MCAAWVPTAAVCSSAGALSIFLAARALYPHPLTRCSGTELDDVHIGEGLHEDNLLDGQDVVVVTRKGDKIKGQMP